ncbi:thioesterase family protein [Amycolatopsis nalaikhensis]|uniref:Hotdog domain-containing protein n=1 Tax=Amycolatopsis nalaikhensis TaxID=715472 RepID=A0ABY8XEL2_9PSEU|nr:hotdog domain-containing protein [Amycolatopsis sp. 2-2]WIV54058.1 hotdog domain-containing protein [Amycolatopsis sp. 2-2]
MSAPEVPLERSGHVAKTVDAADCVHRGGYDVLSTPSVVRLLEEAAMAALGPFLGTGQNSVGATIDIAHVRPTVRGQSVTATAMVTAVDRRRITFAVEAADDVEVIAHGRHERFIVEDAALARRLAEKTALVEPARAETTA